MFFRLTIAPCQPRVDLQGLPASTPLLRFLPWHVMVVGHILRHALAIPPVPGRAQSAGHFFLSVAIDSAFTTVLDLPGTSAPRRA